MNKLISKVEGFCLKHNLILPDSTLIIACSGGPDSLALVLILKEMNIKCKLNLHLIVAHVEHQIRGEDSIADKDFLKEFCKNQNLDFVYKSVDAPQFAMDNKMSLEMAARNLRYEFLYEMACEHQALAIVTAHHQNDLAETIIQHLVRGSGSLGLKGIPIKNRLVIRPLLCLTRKEIEEYCQKKNLNPRQDATNDSLLFQRNRVRKQIIPELVKENPKVISNIAQTAQIIADEQAYLHDKADEYTEQITRYDDKIDAYRIYKKDLLNIHIAIRRLIYRNIFSMLQGNTKDISYMQIERIDELLLSENYHQLVQLSRGLQVINTQDDLIFSHVDIQNIKIKRLKKSPISLNNISGRICNQKLFDEYDAQLDKLPKIGDIKNFILPDGHSITIEMLTKSEADDKINTRLKNNELIIPANLIEESIGCRFRKSGDKIVPKGMIGHKKIKSICIDKKIPQECRGKIPIIYNSVNKDIIWFVGHTISAKYQNNISCNKFLYFRFNN